MGRFYDNKTAWCPVCNQGWIEILKETTTGKLFVCCSECETEWDNPKDVKRLEGTDSKYGPSNDPTQEEIKQMGWDIYIINS